MNHKLIKISIFALIILLAAAGSATAQDPEQVTAIPLGASFTYQGRLNQGGAPASGVFDFEFYLFDTPSGGSLVGGPVAVDDLILSDGYFTVLLDFGTGAFSGQARYLEVRVRPGSDTGSFTILTPRQELPGAG
jgi:hypothetical protein